MSVAPSFQSYEQIGEIFIEKEKPYVMMRNPATGKTRKCRWYGDVPHAETASIQVVRGFAKGYVTCALPTSKEHLEYLRKSNARLSRGLGWHFVSDEDLPSDIPSNLSLVQINWEAASKQGTTAIKTEEQLAQLVKQAAANIGITNFLHESVV